MTWTTTPSSRGGLLSYKEMSMGARMRARCFAMAATACCTAPTNSRPRPSRLLIPALTSKKQHQSCGLTKGRQQNPVSGWHPRIKSFVTKKVKLRCLPPRYRSLFPPFGPWKTWPAVNQGASACSKRERIRQTRPCFTGL
jgi:hypothetical protein